MTTIIKFNCIPFVWLLLLSFPFDLIQAQELSKSELSKYKTLAKNYKHNPALLANLMNKFSSIKQEKEALNDEKLSLEEIVENNNLQIRQLESDIAHLQQELKESNGVFSEDSIVLKENQRIIELESLVQQLELQLEHESKLPEPDLNQNGSKLPEPQNRELDWERGVVYKVQIGAFKENQLPKELKTSDNLDLEEYSEFQRIVVGNFRAYDSAKKLCNYLKTMGVNDAWIASYQDGQRVSIMDPK